MIFFIKLTTIGLKYKNIATIIVFKLIYVKTLNIN